MTMVSSTQIYRSKYIKVPSATVFRSIQFILFTGFVAMYLILLLVFNVCILTNANKNVNVEDILMSNLNSVLSDSNWNFDQINDTAKISNNDFICANHLFLFLSNIKNELWAARMFDAWGKLPSGILSGNFFEFGSYEQCKKISHDTENTTLFGTIEGQYCLLNIPINIPIKMPSRNIGQELRSGPGTPSGLALTLGTCFPSSCSEKFLQTLTGNYNIACEEQSSNLRPIDIAAIVFFSFIAFCLISSTIYELVMMKLDKTPSKLFVSFSLYTNAIKLFTCTEPKPHSDLTKKSGTIECVNGIRGLSIIWVVLSHTYIMQLGAPMINLITLLDWLKEYSSMVIVGASVAVDSFFMMSGMLIGWTVLKELDKSKGRLNVPMMYLHRYLRLTPPYAALIFFVVTLMRYAGSGPMWQPSIFGYAAVCERQWWTSLLYVQNYVNPTDVCISQTWYLSVDMQLYFISPIIVYPLWKWGKKMIPVLGTLTVLSMGCVFASFLVYNLRIGFIAGSDKRFEKTYFPAHTRMGAWLVGIILGYILHSTKSIRVKISKLLVTVGWTLSLGVMIAIIFGCYPLQQLDAYKNPVYADAIFESLNRVIWASALAWVIFACVNGYGGFVNTFLSFTFWQPISRLSYCIYLLHMPIQLLLLNFMRTPLYFSDVTSIHRFWGDFGLTLTVAILWTLAFESPIVGLEKIIFGSGRKTQPKEVAVEPSAPPEISASDVVTIVTVEKEAI